MAEKKGMYIVLISVHGLMRGHNIELGRDADTGGQTKYVIELARALASHEDVDRVDVMTRQVIDAKVNSDYAEPLEKISSNAYIVRLPCGPRRYLRKEVLWPHLDSFSDQALKHVRRIGRVPDVVHGHYADGGYVAVQLSGLLEVPLIFTGHSLGQIKRQRLLDRGMKTASIESQYHISQRIEAEEQILDNATFVVASTQQEVDQQYSAYDNYNPKNMVVMPPGIDLQRFYPPKRGWQQPPFHEEVTRFFKDKNKPMILALSRPDVRKNISALVRAYAENPKLREMANLVVIAGSRENIMSMEKGPRRVLSELLLLIDYYDLYGHVAYPKNHLPDEVPEIYKMICKSRGIFVNPALTEPFGLTLLEAAASGVPIVATEDGGPRDIISNCKNGTLVNPLDSDAIGDALLKMLSDKTNWNKLSKSGINGTRKYYSWDAHVSLYLKEIKRTLSKSNEKNKPREFYKSRLPTADRMLVCDIDNTLIGDEKALKELLYLLDHAGQHIGFGVATGRRIESAKKILQKHGVPMPDFFITSVGCEIHYGPKSIEDMRWKRHIDYRWSPDAVCKAMKGIKGLKLQSTEEQRQYKVSYFIDPDKAPSIREIVRGLRQKNIHVNAIYSHQAYLDFLPVRASKGAALRYFADKWDIPVEHILVAGDSGNDEEMLRGETLGVVVGNYSSELERLHGRERIHFATENFAKGIVEGIEFYDFLGEIRVPKIN